MQLFTAAVVGVPHALAWAPPMGYEWIVILGLGLLIFGKRLPGTARGIGQSITEFKKGLKGGNKDEPAADDAKALAADRKPKFDPFTGKPLAE